MAELAKRNMKCFCCKKTGHTMQDCPHDPNFKTQNDVKTDITRLN